MGPILWIALGAAAVPVVGFVAFLVYFVWIVNKRDEGGSIDGPDSP
jgi:hypothetical protein